MTSALGFIPDWLSGSIDWQALLSHFDMSRGFSFVALLVASEPVARSCKEALDAHLRREGKSLCEVEILTPKNLYELPGTLLTDGSLRVGDATGGIWVELVVSRDLAAYRTWRDAWREAVLSLNEFRNPLSRRFAVPLIFVGAPWLKEVLRDEAPDLWSIRSLVAVIEPVFRKAGPEEFRFEIERRGEGSEYDPELALRKVGELSEGRASDEMRARLLLRAGEGFLERREFERSRGCLDEVLRISERTAIEPEISAESYFDLGIVVEESRKFEDSEQYYLKSLAIAQSNDLTDIPPRVYHQLGNIAVKQENFELAREWYLKSLAVEEEQGNARAAAGTNHQLGRVAQEQQDLETARKWYMKSLATFEKHGDMTGAALSYHQLGRLAEQQLDFETAREWYMMSLAAEEKDGNFHGAGVTLGQLGVLAQGEHKFEESARLLARGIALLRQVHDPYRAGQAEDYFRVAYEQASNEEKTKFEKIWREAGLGDFPAEWSSSARTPQ